MQILDINNLEELRKYDLFVVDFDGTIVDSMFMWRYICPNFLIYKNIHTEDDILSMITSLTNKEIAKFIRDRYFPDESLEKVTEDFFAYIKMEYVNQKLKPNSIQLLEKLNEFGTVVLYSATALYLVETLVNVLDIRKYFKDLYSGSDLGVTKRDGTGYLEVIRLCGDYKNPLILEDAPHAVLGAASQNLDVLVISDFSNENKLDSLEGFGKYLLK